MPFKHAHWLVVALLPVIALAFWPAYFGNLRGASVAFHAHGLSASAWILLVDTLAGSIIFLSISGVILWVETSRRKMVGAIIFLLSATTILSLALSRL